MGDREDSQILARSFAQSLSHRPPLVHGMMNNDHLPIWAVHILAF
jgi:hypothetical protein